jgi:hypothetical protein
MKQIALDVGATSTKVRFSDGAIDFDVVFTSPFLMNDLKVMSRPLAYVTFVVSSADGKPHDVAIYFDAPCQLCLNDPAKSDAIAEAFNCAGLKGARVGNSNQENMLDATGDNMRIDWGWLALFPMDSGAQALPGNAYLRRVFTDTGKLDMDVEVWGGRKPEDVRLPLVAVKLEIGVFKQPVSKAILLAYDDFASIEYFHSFRRAYCYRDGESFADIVRLASEEYALLMKRCTEFDACLRAKAVEAGGEEYADLLALAYRQAIAAHKLISDEEHNAVFLSKECFSNGCIGTTDVSYPSIPLVLLYNPELVKGMIRPIFRYARSPEWPFDFAPHDVGRYPRANRQVYGRLDGKYAEKWQMPVEECGNMLIMTAAACNASKDYTIASDNMDLLEKWVEYLKFYGQDPGNQLCTDDFAGHLAHNTNLAIKAIVGIGAYALILKNTGYSGYEERIGARQTHGSKLGRYGEGQPGLQAGIRPGWLLVYEIQFAFR